MNATSPSELVVTTVPQMWVRWSELAWFEADGTEFKGAN